MVATSVGKCLAAPVRWSNTSWPIVTRESLFVTFVPGDLRDRIICKFLIFHFLSSFLFWIKLVLCSFNIIITNNTKLHSTFKRFQFNTYKFLGLLLGQKVLKRDWRVVCGEVCYGEVDFYRSLKILIWLIISTLLPQPSSRYERSINQGNFQIY